MRTLLLALLLAAPIGAVAQTPRDLARLAGGTSASVSSAPAADPGVAPGATAADLARLSSPRPRAIEHAASPSATAEVDFGATPRGLARLVSSGSGLWPAGRGADSLFAARTPRPRG
jgi:hypothetical protein